MGVGTRPDTLRTPCLSPRQREVYALLMQGYTNKEIAEHLSLKVQTVKNHVQMILYRFGVHNRIYLILGAVEEGFRRDTHNR